MIVRYKAYWFPVLRCIKRESESMGKDFYCPVCGAFQEHVNLEETDNTFICDKCKSVIHFDKLSDDRSEIRFTIYSTDEEK